MPADRSSTTSKRFGWERPRWKDRAFLAAIAITVVLVAIEAALLGDPGTTWWYLGLAAQALVTWIIVSAIIRIRVGIRRGLVHGYRESAERPADAGPSTAENVAKAGGRTVGRALAAYKRSQQKPSS